MATVTDEELDQLRDEVLAMFDRVDRDLPDVVLTPAQRDMLLESLGISPENIDAVLALTPIPVDERGVWGEGSTD